MKRLVLTLVLAAFAAGAVLGHAKTATAKSSERRIHLTVTGSGFEPAAIKVKAGQPLRLLVTRKTERTCATDIVVKDYGIRRALPLDKAVEVRFTPRRPGVIRYACAMDMIAGKLIVE